MIAGALVLAFLNALPALLGGVSWYRGAGADTAAVRAFWVLLRTAQVAAVLYALAVGVLAATGRSPSERLFYLYALLPLAVSFVAEQLRLASAQTILDQRGLESAADVGSLPESEQFAVVAAIVHRELGVMTLSALVVVFLALRAAATAHGL
ncbi:MAG TPA: hypothetical protein VGL37_07220 [Solirubrobacteraceae bacterium]|jgi:hypothetical protein